MSRQSRFLTFMFCDIVDSTRMTQSTDGEEAFELIEGFQALCGEQIRLHQGFVARYMGDGVLAYFGYPVAMENSAEAAVRCAHSVVERMRAAGSALSVRVGIANGRGVFGKLELSGGGAEIAAVSNAANLAARLQSQAEPNQIVVSDEVFEQLEGLFTFHPPRSVELKGFDREQRIHAVAGLGSFASASHRHAERGPGSTIQREAVLGTALQAWEATVSEAHGRSVLVRGPGGIGKTTLLRECRQRLDDRAQSITLYASRFAEHTAFEPIRRFIERALAENAAGNLHQWVGDFVDAGRVAEYSDVLEILLGRRSPAEWPPNVLREKLFEYLVGLLGAMSGRKPLLILVEDLHWLDASSAELLTRLRAAFDAHALLVLASSRPTEVNGASQWDLTIDVGPLADDQVLALIDALDPEHRLGDDTRASIARKAGGVPLLVREFTRATLAAAGRDGGPAAVVVPDTLLESFAAQLDRWSSAKDLLDVAAVAGEAFPATLLAQALARDADEIGGVLESLVGAELMQTYRTSKGQLFDFAHALLRDAAYNALLPKQRQALHSQVLAAWQQLEPEFARTRPSQAAHHFAATGAHAQAITTLLAAAQGSFAASHCQEASGMIRQALALLPQVAPEEQRKTLEFHLQTLLALTLTQLRGFADEGVKQAYSRAWELGVDVKADGESEFATTWGIWAYRHVVNDTDGAMELVDKLGAIAAAGGARHLRLLAASAAVAVECNRGHLAESLRHAGQVVELYDPTQHGQLALGYSMDPKLIALLYSSHCCAVQGEGDRAEALRTEAFALAERLGFEFILPYTQIWGWASTLYAGAPEHMLETLERLIALATRLGNTFWICAGILWKGAVHRHRGEWQAALGNLQAGIEIADKVGLRVTMPYLRSLYADVLARSEPERAWPVFESCIRESEAGGARFHLAETHRLYAHALLRHDRGLQDPARSQLRRGLDLAATQGASLWTQAIMGTVREFDLGDAPAPARAAPDDAPGRSAGAAPAC